MNDRNQIAKIVMQLIVSGGKCTIEMFDGSTVNCKSLLGASMNLSNLHRPDTKGIIEIETEKGKVKIDLTQVKSLI